MSRTEENEENTENRPRRKGLTSLSLKWLAEKLRRADELKAQISNGQYKVDSNKVASSILNKEDN